MYEYLLLALLYDLLKCYLSLPDAISLSHVLLYVMGFSFWPYCKNKTL